MGEDIERNILKKIKKTGFPLELRVGDVLHRNNYYVATNVYSLDQEEGKGREFDIRALKNWPQKIHDIDYSVKHCLLIECKKSDDPWVVFTSPKTSYDKKLLEVDSTGGARFAYKEGSKHPKEVRGTHTVIQTVRRTSGCDLREESTGDVVLSVLI